LTAGQVVAEPVVLAAKRCARIQAVGGPGLRRLGLTAVDTNGHELARTEGDANSTYLHLCSPAQREASIQVHAAAGAGQFALAISDAPIASVVPAGADDQLGAELQQATREARDLGFRPHSELKNGPRHLVLHGNEPLVIKLGPDSAHCLRAYVLSN